MDFSNFTLDNVDKIEVVHGAESALYGSDAMTGVIQIFTHRGDTRTPELDLEGDGGSFDTGQGSAVLSGLLGRFDYSLGNTYFSTNGQGPNDFFFNRTNSGSFGWKFSKTQYTAPGGAQQHERRGSCRADTFPTTTRPPAGSESGQQPA